MIDRQFMPKTTGNGCALLGVERRHNVFKRGGKRHQARFQLCKSFIGVHAESISPGGAE